MVLRINVRHILAVCGIVFLSSIVMVDFARAAAEFGSVLTSMTRGSNGWTSKGVGRVLLTKIPSSSDLVSIQWTLNGLSASKQYRAMITSSGGINPSITDKDHPGSPYSFTVFRCLEITLNTDSQGSLSLTIQGNISDGFNAQSSNFLLGRYIVLLEGAASEANCHASFPETDAVAYGSIALRRTTDDNLLTGSDAGAERSVMSYMYLSDRGLSSPVGWINCQESADGNTNITVSVRSGLRAGASYSVVVNTFGDLDDMMKAALADTRTWGIFNPTNAAVDANTGCPSGSTNPSGVIGSATANSDGSLSLVIARTNFHLGYGPNTIIGRGVVLREGAGPCADGRMTKAILIGSLARNRVYDIAAARALAAKGPSPVSPATPASPGVSAAGSPGSPGSPGTPVSPATPGTPPVSPVSPGPTSSSGPTVTASSTSSSLSTSPTASGSPGLRAAGDNSTAPGTPAPAPAGNGTSDGSSTLSNGSSGTVTPPTSSTSTSSSPDASATSIPSDFPGSSFKASGMGDIFTPKLTSAEGDTGSSSGGPDGLPVNGSKGFTFSGSGDGNGTNSTDGPKLGPVVDTPVGQIQTVVNGDNLLDNLRGLAPDSPAGAIPATPGASGPFSGSALQNLKTTSSPSSPTAKQSASAAPPRLGSATHATVLALVAGALCLLGAGAL